MLGRFLRDSTIYGVSGILSRGICIVLVPIYTRLLQPDAYGALDLLIVFATLTNYIVAMEISQALARFYPTAETPDDRFALVSSALWFAAASYGLFVTIGLLFSASLAPSLLDSAKWTGATQAAILAVGANGMFFILQDLLRWKRKPKRHAIANMLYALVGATTGIGFVLAGAGVAGILFGQCIGALAGIGAIWRVASVEWRLTFSWRWLKTMLTYCTPLVPSSIAVYFSMYLDRFMIKEMMTLGDVGIYGVGARFAAMVGLLIIGVQSALTPLVFTHYREPQTPGELARIFRYFLCFAIAGVILLTSFARELVWLFATPQYYGAWGIIPLLGLALLLGNIYIFFPGLFLGQRTGTVALINIGAALINLAGNLLLIPWLGIIGAALATIITATLSLSLYTIFSQYLYPVPHSWRRIAGAFVAGGGIALGIALFGGGDMEALSFGPAIIKLSICAGALFLVSWMLLGRREIFTIVGRLKDKSAH